MCSSEDNLTKMFLEEFLETLLTELLLGCCCSPPLFVVLDEEVLVIVLAEEVVGDGQALVLHLTHFIWRA